LPVSGLTSLDLRVRDYTGTVEQLTSLKATYQAALPERWRWEDWGPEPRRNYELMQTADGLRYALCALRLSFAAETVLYGWPSLVDLVHRVADESGARYGQHAIGNAGASLNAMAREIAHLLWAMMGGIVT
jgi:hypothetical protein